MSSSSFQYVALDSAGRKVRGVVEAESAKSAHAGLHRQGLTALSLGYAHKGKRFLGAGFVGGLSRRALSEFLHDLGALTQSGVTLRSALSVLAAPAERNTPTGKVAAVLDKEIASGKSLDAAFSKALGRNGYAIAGLVAAAEISGDLGGTLARAAENMEQELEAGEGIIAALSYPAFVLLMTSISVLVILIAVVPALAPLVAESKQRLPLPMTLMFSASAFLIGHARLLLIGLAASLGLGLMSWRLGLLRKPVELWLLDGPVAGLARGVVFGGVVTVFGTLVAANVPASQALQLAQRTTAVRVARDRFSVCVLRIREGAAVSQALATCKGMPRSALRLAAVGEEVGKLGDMLERAGRLERGRALRRIRSISGWLAPALIVVLGALIGLILASLLSSVAAIGDAASTS